MTDKEGEGKDTGVKSHLKLEEHGDLLESPSHQLAAMAMQGAMGTYFQHLDTIGFSNQEITEENGHAAVHMTVLMVAGLMSHITNVFARVNSDEIQSVHDDLADFIKHAPRLAQEALAEADGGDVGRA